MMSQRIFIKNKKKKKKDAFALKQTKQFTLLINLEQQPMLFVFCIQINSTEMYSIF